MPRPEFAVALWRGVPQALVNPDQVVLWSQFVERAQLRWPLGDLIQMELQLRTGRVWRSAEGDLSLLALPPELASTKCHVEILTSYQESLNAVKH